MRAALIVILGFLAMPVIAMAGGRQFAVAAPAVSVASASGRLTLPRPKAGRTRPLVVVVGDNRGAEVTDFIIPYGVLKDSGVADVRALSTRPGPIQLRMALRIAADQTLAEFDAAEPGGADIVVVPAQMKPNDKVLVGWVKAQADRGAVIVSICEGARVVARAGLLHGRRATTHWGALKPLAKAYPDTVWVRDQRYVQDGPVVSTTGVSASIPASLALVEAIGGREVARATAARLGVTDWGTAHRTDRFAISKLEIARALAVIASPWKHETVEAPIADGVDEIGLALRADVWERSFRARVVTTHADLKPVRSRRGLILLPDARARPGRFIIPGGSAPAMVELDAAIAAMGRRYGPFAARLAWLGLEYEPPAGG